MENMKTLTIGGITFDITDDGAARFDEAQSLTAEEKAQARENVGAENIVAAPSTIAENDMLVYNGTAWETVSKNDLVNSGPQLPTTTAEDDGKFLRVVDGAWAAVSVTDGNTVAY